MRRVLEFLVPHLSEPLIKRKIIKLSVPPSRSPFCFPTTTFQACIFRNSLPLPSTHPPNPSDTVCHAVKMSADKISVIVDAVRVQIYSTRQILTIGTVPSPDDANIKAVIESLCGPEWPNLTPEKQQTNENIIRKIYAHQLKNYLPVLLKHLDEAEQIPKPDSALLADLDFEPDEMFNSRPVQCGPETKQEFDRDQAARTNLDARYHTYKQGLRHVVQRRGAGELDSEIPRVDFKTYVPQTYHAFTIPELARRTPAISI